MSRSKSLYADLGFFYEAKNEFTYRDKIFKTGSIFFIYGKRIRIDSLSVEVQCNYDKNIFIMPSKVFYHNTKSVPNPKKCTNITKTYLLKKTIDGKYPCINLLKADVSEGKYQVVENCAGALNKFIVIQFAENNVNKYLVNKNDFLKNIDEIDTPKNVMAIIHTDKVYNVIKELPVYSSILSGEPTNYNPHTPMINIGYALDVISYADKWVKIRRSFDDQYWYCRRSDFIKNTKISRTISDKNLPKGKEITIIDINKINTVELSDECELHDINISSSSNECELHDINISSSSNEISEGYYIARRDLTIYTWHHQANDMFDFGLLHKNSKLWIPDQTYSKWLRMSLQNKSGGYCPISFYKNIEKTQYFITKDFFIPIKLAKCSLEKCK